MKREWNGIPGQGGNNFTDREVFVSCVVEALRWVGGVLWQAFQVAVWGVLVFATITFGVAGFASSPWFFLIPPVTAVLAYRMVDWP